MTVHLENNRVLLPCERLLQCAGGAGCSAEQPVRRYSHHKQPLELHPGFWGFPIPAFLKEEIEYQLGI